MDKPISMSVKDYLIRTLAVKIMVSEKVIETIVNHQFQSANEAMEHAKAIGLLLIQKKAELPHGEYGKEFIKQKTEELTTD